MKCSNCGRRKKNYERFTKMDFNGLGKTKSTECFCSKKCEREYRIKKGV